MPKLSRRALIIGLLLSIIVALWGEYAANHLGYELAATQLPSVLLIPFLLFIALPNILITSVSSRFGLNRSELIVVFAMGLVASMVPDQALTKYLLVVITAPHYFANQENRWEAQFFDYLPNWLVLQNQGDAVRLFYEGVQPGQSIPWMAWLPPIFWWFSLIAVLMFIGACLVVILRKQWMEHERLRFPLGEVALHLLGTKEDPRKPGEAGMFQSPMFKIGCFFMSIVMIWNILSFWSVVPPIPIMGSDSMSLFIDPAFPPFVIRLNVFVLCLLFFVNTEILFSLWTFQVLYNIQAGVLNTLGISSISGTIVAGGLVGIQAIGGLIIFVLWGLWMARQHIIKVVHTALGHTSDLDDADELFSYRTALFGLLFGLVYMIWWLHKGGLSFPVMALFLFLLFIFYLALARVVAETGLVSVDLPINSHQFTVGIIGSANINPGDLTTLGMANGFARNWRTFTMIGTSHVAWVRTFVGTQKQVLFQWCAIAFALSLVTSVSYLIYAGYTFGAQNLRTDLGRGRGEAFYGLITTWINNATQISEMEALFLLSGVVIMMLVTAANYLFYWWPLHPIGMVVVMSAPVINSFFPVVLAWLIQWILLRIGGVALYRKAQPLFIGILVAYLLGQVVALVVDLVWFPDSPHVWEMY